VINSLISNVIDSPLRLGEGLGVRSTEKAVEMMKLTKQQIEVAKKVKDEK
jgi:hypothetical protein